MTRRDYIELAAELKRARISGTDSRAEINYNNGVDCAAQYIANLCAARDAKFDVQRFLKNAGVQS